MSKKDCKYIFNRFSKYLIYIFSVAFAAIFLTGCAANITNSVGIDISNSKKQDEMFLLGEYKKAAQLACEDKDTKATLDEANLLSTLYAGNCFLYDNENKQSLKLLDEAEAIVKFHQEEALASSTLDYTAQLLLNDAALDYKATITDAIMINTYKALNHMALNNFSEARVELNRAIDRQRRAKNTYAKLIAKQKEAIALKKKEVTKKGKELKKDGLSEGFDKTLNNPLINDIVSKNYTSLGEFEAYPDFINPFTTYLAGLFFTLEGDYAKASSLLKEVRGMMPKNKVVKSDFHMVEAALSGKKINKNHIWVIYENGLGPIKSQYKLDIPIFLVTNKINYAGIALPKLKLRNRASNTINIVSNEKVLASTSVVASMDRVIMTEFNYSYKDIVTRAVFSAVLKAYGQYEANKQNFYAGLAAGIFQFVTTQADTRVWSTIPKDFQIAKVKMPKNKKLVLQAGSQSIDVEIDEKAKNSIVYVKLPTEISKASVFVVNF